MYLCLFMINDIHSILTSVSMLKTFSLCTVCTGMCVCARYVIMNLYVRYVMFLIGDLAILSVDDASFWENTERFALTYCLVSDISTC